MNTLKKMKWWIAAACIVVVTGTVVVVNVNGAKPPEKTEQLDLSLTENEFYLDTNDFETQMNEVVNPFLEKYMQEGYVTSDGLSLHYETYELPKAESAIVISHGYTEYTDKYNEIIYYFLNAGYSVYMMEHRGHGYSEREVEDLSLCYVDDYNDYIDDLHVFVKEIVTEQFAGENLYIYAHSMGGAIATGFLEQYPEYFDAAVLSAPLMKVHLGDVPEWAARMLTAGYLALGKEEAYVLGHGAYEGVYEVEDTLGCSQARCAYYISLQPDNENYQLNGASYAWLNASFKITKQILKKENLDKIEIPVLLFTAENDTYVRPEGHYVFAAGVDSCRYIYVENSDHQVYSTQNEIMIPYFNTIFGFLEEN